MPVVTRSQSKLILDKQAQDEKIVESKFKMIKKNADKCGDIDNLSDTKIVDELIRYEKFLINMQKYLYDINEFEKEYKMNELMNVPMNEEEQNKIYFKRLEMLTKLYKYTNLELLDSLQNKYTNIRFNRLVKIIYTKSDGFITELSNPRIRPFTFRQKIIVRNLLKVLINTQSTILNYLSQN